MTSSSSVIQENDLIYILIFKNISQLTIKLKWPKSFEFQNISSEMIFKQVTHFSQDILLETWYDDWWSKRFELIIDNIKLLTPISKYSLKIQFKFNVLEKVFWIYKKNSDSLNKCLKENFLKINSSYQSTHFM